MSADDLASLLRLVGLPLWIYGLVALMVWNKRTESSARATTGNRPYQWPNPKAGVAPRRSIFQALRSDEQPEPPARYVVSLTCGLLLTFVGLVIGIVD